MKDSYFFSLVLGLFLLLGAALSALAEDDPTFPNSVYLITSAETQPGGSGLSTQGDLRAICLVEVFGLLSNRSVGYIITDPPAADGSNSQYLDTVSPLALTLAITVDTSCSADDKDCIGDAATAFATNSDAGILICSDPTYLPDIAEVLGVNDVPAWPKNSVDTIWTVVNNELVSQTSEGCLLDDILR
ncbi:hypothetical protein M0805_004392 [Coniferiporia weirii]|nr:hypothetical protein M0805_004392 [Coniferiporia weirii]